MQKLSKKIIYCWACDYSSKTGEGNLARLFLSKKIGKKKVYYPKMFFNKKSIFNYKYILPLIGIVFCWYFYFKKKNTAYINYLPLWNCIIFFLLPPNTILGPITGGAYYSKNSNYHIRKFIFPILYKFSELIISFRFKNPIFSTSLLKRFLNNKTIKNSEFDYVFNYINKTKLKKKTVDFVVYFKKHKNKEKLFNYKLINKLIKLKFNVYCIGDQLTLKKIKNLGFLSKKKLNDLLSRTRYTICSPENIYSLYTLDCINNNVKILTQKNFNKNIYKYKKQFIFIRSDFKDLKIKVK